MSVDVAVTGLEAQGYEERFLFLLLLLAQPRARMIYVTSQAIHPSVIEYYLDLAFGRDSESRPAPAHFALALR